ncbi:hypothetical protein [Bradyrhizobium sp. AZCC 1693]|uniref:hypothetical protein n=1 Tax=Bradyrhizobium sp. AZCC 1693 TaxID=3117029 RepID=UPI002FF22132
MVAVDEAKRAMFRPERLIEIVPDRQPVFLLVPSRPYQEGQAVINGVYFPPEHAEPLLKSLAEEQAKAISARQHLKKPSGSERRPDEQRDIRSATRSEPVVKNFRALIYAIPIRSLRTK